MRRSPAAIAVSFILVLSATTARPLRSQPPPEGVAAAHEAEPALVLPSFVRFPDHQYALTEGFKFTFRGTRRSVTVPAGFVTDFASIPGVVQPLFSKEELDLPGLVHDFLYWRQSCTREEADKLFEAALEQLGVPQVKRWAIYSAVRAAGGSAWTENARDRGNALPRIIPAAFMHIPAMRWKDYREQLREQHVTLDTKDAHPPDYCHLPS